MRTRSIYGAGLRFDHHIGPLLRNQQQSLPASGRRCKCGTRQSNHSTAHHRGTTTCRGKIIRAHAAQGTEDAASPPNAVRVNALEPGSGIQHAGHMKVVVLSGLPLTRATFSCRFGSMMVRRKSRLPLCGQRYRSCSPLLPLVTPWSETRGTSPGSCPGSPKIQTSPRRSPQSTRPADSHTFPACRRDGVGRL